MNHVLQKYVFFLKHFGGRMEKDTVLVLFSEQGIPCGIKCVVNTWTQHSLGPKLVKNAGRMWNKS